MKVGIRSSLRNWLLDPVSKIKINLFTLAIDYKNIEKIELTAPSPQREPSAAGRYDTQ